MGNQFKSRPWGHRAKVMDSSEMLRCVLGVGTAEGGGIFDSIKASGLVDRRMRSR